MTAVKRKVGRPISNVQSAQTTWAMLKEAEKTAKENRAQFEKEIRAGFYPDAFRLETPKAENYVPAAIWKAHVGQDWITANEVPKNQSLVIKLK